MRRAAAALALLAIGLVQPGCGYHLSGRGSFLPGRIQTIGIPPFDSSIPRQELTDRLTAEVTREFISRGGYRIVPRPEGDAVLLGNITGFELTPAAIDAEGRQTRTFLTITAGVTLRDLAGNTVLYENPSFQFRAELELSTDEQQFLDTESEAIDQIAVDFARSLVATILEGF